MLIKPVLSYRFYVLLNAFYCHLFDNFYRYPTFILSRTTSCSLLKHLMYTRRNVNDQFLTLDTFHMFDPIIKLFHTFITSNNKIRFTFSFMWFMRGSMCKNCWRRMLAKVVINFFWEYRGRRWILPFFILFKNICFAKTKNKLFYSTRQ